MTKDYKYQRICVSISDDNKRDLNEFVKLGKKRIKSINTSTVVDMALANFFQKGNFDATFGGILEDMQKNR